MKSDKNFTYEIIIVCDGSKDQTSNIAWDYSKKYGVDKVRLLKLVKNRGKGGAVTQVFFFLPFLSFLFFFLFLFFLYFLFFLSFMIQW